MQNVHLYTGYDYGLNVCPTSGLFICYSYHSGYESGSGSGSGSLSGSGSGWYLLNIFLLKSTNPLAMFNDHFVIISFHILYAGGTYQSYKLFKV